jgi:hypothetical protein
LAPSATTSGVLPRRDSFDGRGHFLGEDTRPSPRHGRGSHGRTLADLAPVDVDAAHSRLRGETARLRAEVRPRSESAFGQDHDRAPFGRLVGKRRQLRGVGQRGLFDAGRRMELRRLAVAERDRAGLVEQQHVDIARRLDRAARRGEHVGRIIRLIPAMPIADSSAPIVVGIRQTSSAMSTVISPPSPTR